MSIVITIPTSRIFDWESFHSVFAEACGFPDFYGRNRNAWIDCMTYLDDPDAGMTTVHCAPGDRVTLQLGDQGSFAARCPEQHQALVECAAFVNWRREEQGEPAVLTLSWEE